MSDEIGPVHIKERPGSEMQSRIDAEVCFCYPLQLRSVKYSLSILICLPVSQVVKLLRDAYNRVKALLKKVRLMDSHNHTICKTWSLAPSYIEEFKGSSLTLYSVHQKIT